MEKELDKRGYLEGTHMASAFNMQRSNDFIWSFVVRNYLLGQDPFPFDLMYWNSDSTRMPRNMHTFYLRNMYQKNLLREPGGIELAGEPIDLGQIDVPSYFLSTHEDHIAPCKSTYLGTQLQEGKPRFVLGGSGYIAGVINPEGFEKYGFWTSDDLPADPDSWFEGAEFEEGSWWRDWFKWVKKRAGALAAARQPGDGKLAVVGDAPGSYVKMRIDG